MPTCTVIKLKQCTMAKAFSIVLEKKATSILTTLHTRSAPRTGNKPPMLPRHSVTLDRGLDGWIVGEGILAIGWELFVVEQWNRSSAFGGEKS